MKWGLTATTAGGQHGSMRSRYPVELIQFLDKPALYFPVKVAHPAYQPAHNRIAMVEKDFLILEPGRKTGSENIC